LQYLARYVQRHVQRVDNAPGEFEPPRHDVLELVIDERPLYVQAHVANVLVEHVNGKFEREHTGYVQYALVLDLTLEAEVVVCEGLIVRGPECRLVKVPVFLGRDVRL
jgi:hypothetical protein